ncbi:MAG: PEGA domain-containing protein [Myxococcaceae bacterium]|nr:PEGA domain-containing protein [Myxococcaceae bacterium]
MKRYLLMGLFAACAHTAPASETKADEPKPETKVIVADEPGLKVLSEPDDAELTVDGQSYGKVSALTGALQLKPGIYQVSLKRGGYQTWRAEVAVGDKTEQLRVVMVKQ